MRYQEGDLHHELLEPYWKGSVLGMPAYEGIAQMMYFSRRPGAALDSQKSEDLEEKRIPFFARLIIGANAYVPREGSVYHHPDVFTDVFFDVAYFNLSNQVGFVEGDRETPKIVALQTILKRAERFPHIPITLLYAHGNSSQSGVHYVKTVNEDTQWLHSVITNIIAFDKSRGRMYERDELTVVLVSCNEKKITINDKALLIYRNGIAGTLYGTGGLVISRTE